MTFDNIENIKTSFSDSYNSFVENGSSPQEAFLKTLDELTNNLSELGISSELAGFVKSSCLDIFQNSILNGKSIDEAINSSLDNLKLNLEKIEISKESDSDYKFDYINPFDSNNSKLIDEGLAQGMTVEEAVKNANLKLFPEQNVQGPPTLSELKELEEKETQVVEKIPNDKENEQLNIMEADMDAEESANLIDNSKTINKNDEYITESENSAQETKDDEVG